MTDPDIRLGGKSRGGSRHSARGTSCFGSRHSARGRNSICFPVSHFYFLVERGPKSIVKLDGGHGQIPPLYLPLLAITQEKNSRLSKP